MPNLARGETSIHVKGVGDVILCLTLAGMAHLEDAFEVDNLEEAIAKVGTEPSSTNLATILHALTLGSKSYSVEEIRKWPVTPAAIKDAMAAMNASNEDAAGNASAPSTNRQARRAAAARKKP